MGCCLVIKNVPFNVVVLVVKIEIPMSYLFLFRYRLSFQKLINFTKKIYIYIYIKIYRKSKNLPDGELNPGLPRDRWGYSPIYYRGLDVRRMNLNEI